MPESRRLRLSAFLAGIAVVAASLVPAFPAAAVEPPTPDPAVTSEPVVEPVETTPEPVETPTPDPTPVVEPAETPAPDPTESSTPEPDPVPDEMVQYSGALTLLATEDGDDSGRSYPLLSVDGLGFLRVDTSDLPVTANLSGSVELTLVVPAGLTLSDDPATRFAQLAAAAATSPLVAIDYARLKQTAPRQTANAVNQSPAASAVHQVYAVLVSPNSLGFSSSSQTPEIASDLVTYADDFWGRQSNGGPSIDFTLAATVPWYKSTYSCKTDSGSTSLWNQAAAKAATFGYKPGKNVHLMLLFPKTADCAGAIGLGTIGGSINSGGLLWVVGGNSIQIRKATTAHELGHNMSLGHADWLQCNTAAAPVGAAHVIPETATALSKISGCKIHYYGDIADVMGYGIDSPEIFDGGSLSAPSAIRAGIWPSSAWANPTGANQVLQPVSSNSGVRAIVVQDSDGTNYFVEYRDYNGDDSEAHDWECYPAGGACVDDVTEAKGVRILRMEPSGYQGLPGYDSFLIGYKTGNASRPDDVKLSAGQSYTTELGTSIQVISTGATATVKVLRTAFAPHTGSVDVDKSISAKPGTAGVGDTLSVFLGDSWAADSFTYQWKRNGSINLGTNPSYVLTVADLGQMITATVVGKISGQADTSAVTSPGYGPIVAGTLYGTGTVGATGSLQIGQTLTASSTYTATNINGGAVATTTSYQWYREGVAIAGETANTYATQSADYLKKVTVKAVLKATGYADYFSPASTAIIPNVKGDIQGSHAIPTMVKTIPALPAKFFLTATLPVGSITEAGTSTAYQWYRVNRSSGAATAISGATHQDYTPVSGDYAYKLKVRLTITKANYNTLTLYALPKDYSLRFTPLKVGGTPTVDASLSPFSTETGSLPQFSFEDDSGVVQIVLPDTQLATWYRSGVTGSVGTGPIYDVKAADVGKKMTYKLSATAVGYLPIVNALSASSATVTKGTFVPGGSTPTLNDPSGTLLLSVTSAFTDVSNAATSMTYQWYRNGVAVSGKTGTTYQLTASDFNKVISVNVTYKKSGYVSRTRTAVYAGGVANFTVATDVPATMTGPQLVDSSSSTVLTANLGTYTSKVDGSGIATSGSNPTFQWLRDGVPIALATAQDYDPQPADKGHKISVRVTMTAPGLLPNVQVPAATSALGDTLLDNSTDPVDVVIDGTPTATKTVLKANALTLGPSPVTVKYQWLRDGAAIKDATAQKYTLTKSDWGKDVSVRVTTSKSPANGKTYTTAVRYSTPHDYSIIPDAGSEPYLSTSEWAVGAQAGVYGLNFTDAGDAPLTGTTITYQWYIGGVAVTGATLDYFYIPASAYGKKVTVRITVTKPGYIPLTYYPNQPYTVQKGTTTAIPTVDVESAGLGMLQATISTPTPSYPTPAYTYQWTRNGSSISGATAKTYKLTSSDYGKTVTVKVTMKRTNFVVATQPLAIPTALDYSIRGDGQATITPLGTVTVGQTLHADPPQFLEADGTTNLVPTPTYTYRWYTGTTLLATTSSPDFILTSAHKGKTIKVKVTAAAPGALRAPRRATAIRLLRWAPARSCRAPSTRPWPTPRRVRARSPRR